LDYTNQDAVRWLHVFSLLGVQFLSCLCGLFGRSVRCCARAVASDACCWWICDTPSLAGESLFLHPSLVLLFKVWGLCYVGFQAAVAGPRLDLATGSCGDANVHGRVFSAADLIVCFGARALDMMRGLVQLPCSTGFAAAVLQCCTNEGCWVTL
jgi:hypothetical protein